MGDGSQHSIKEDFLLAQRIAHMGYWWEDHITGRSGMSEGARRIHGLEAKANVNFEDYLELVHEEDRPLLEEAVRQLIETGEPFQIVYRISRADNGEVRYIENQAVVRDTSEEGNSYFGVYHDVTHIKQKERKARQGQNDIEVLLQEVHHRVKNNLATISGLLELQAHQLTEGEASRALLNSKSRVKAIANVHEAIYQSSSSRNIYLDDYLERLLQAIEETHANKNKEIQVHLGIDPEISIGFNRAVNVALLVNELVVNAYKHAFKGRDEGNIFIEGAQNEKGIQLTVKDDGVGLDKQVWEESDTLGGSLIQSLSKQLGADLDITSNGGTSFILQFEQ